MSETCGKDERAPLADVRFTEATRRALAEARSEAKRLNHDYIGTEHVLLGLLREPPSVIAGARVVLARLRKDPLTIRAQVAKLAPARNLPSRCAVALTPRAHAIPRIAAEVGATLGHREVGSEHLLLALVREHECAAAQVLLQLGVGYDQVRDEVVKLRGLGAPRLLDGVVPDPWDTPEDPVERVLEPIGEIVAAGADLVGATLAQVFGIFEPPASAPGPAVRPPPAPTLQKPLAAIPAPPFQALPADAEKPLPALPAKDDFGCPRGHGRMEEVSREGVRVAICPTCLGSFFPPGELEKLFAKVAARAAATAPEALRKFLEPES